MSPSSFGPKVSHQIQKIRDEQLIPLDKEAFRFKKDGSMREGHDILGRSGSATRAMTQAVGQAVEICTKNPSQTPEQMALALRERSTHPEARLFFKSAGLIDRDKFDTLKHVMSQRGKLLDTALERDTLRARVSNEKQQMANTMLLAFVDAPSHGSDGGERVSVPSRGGNLSLLMASHTQQAQGR